MVVHLLRKCPLNSFPHLLQETHHILLLILVVRTVLLHPILRDGMVHLLPNQPRLGDHQRQLPFLESRIYQPMKQ